MDTTSKTLGKMMKDARKARDLSQVELAERIGKEQAAISEWENDKRKIAVVDFIAWANDLDLTRSEWAAFRELGYPDVPDPSAASLRAS